MTKAANTDAFRRRCLGYACLVLPGRGNGLVPGSFAAHSRGDIVRVPAHWSTEVANGFLVTFRKKRLTLDEVREILRDLKQLPIFSESALSPASSERVIDLAIQNELTLYDAAYLDLAKRLSLPIATLDRDLRKAAIAAGISLL